MPSSERVVEDVDEMVLSAVIEVMPTRRSRAMSA